MRKLTKKENNNNKNKKQTLLGENIFIVHTLDKELVSRIHKEVLPLSKNKMPQFTKSKMFDQTLHKGRYNNGQQAQ